MKNFRIPIKPYLKKFILKRYRSVEPIEVDEKSILGVCVIKILMEQRTHKFNTVLEDYTERIEISLTQDMIKRSPRLSRLVHVNVDLSKMFKESLFTWIDAQMKLGNPATDGVKSFLEYHKIDELEYSFDAAHKAWLRFKNYEYNKKKSTTINL